MRWDRRGHQDGGGGTETTDTRWDRHQEYWENARNAASKMRQCCSEDVIIRSLQLFVQFGLYLTNKQLWHFMHGGIFFQLHLVK